MLRYGGPIWGPPTAQVQSLDGSRKSSGITVMRNASWKEYMTVHVGLAIVGEYRLEARSLLSSREILGNAHIGAARPTNTAIAPWLAGHPLNHISVVLLLFQSVPRPVTF